MSNDKQDVYARITDKIIAYLEAGGRPGMKPWSASHTTGHITRPLRHNGQPYNGINILNLWASAMEQGLTAPRWMTFAQASNLKAMSAEARKARWWFIRTLS